MDAIEENHHGKNVPAVDLDAIVEDANPREIDRELEIRRHAVLARVVRVDVERGVIGTHITADTCSTLLTCPGLQNCESL